MPAGRPRTAGHGTDSRYGAGCRCGPCRAAHAEASTAYKRDQRYGPGGASGPEVRARILALLEAGRTVAQAACELGITHQQIYGAAQALPDFGARIAELTAPAQA
jgi:hypothetical protein